MTTDVVKMEEVAVKEPKEILARRWKVSAAGVVVHGDEASPPPRAEAAGAGGFPAVVLLRLFRPPFLLLFICCFVHVFLQIYDLWSACYVPVLSFFLLQSRFESRSSPTVCSCLVSLFLLLLCFLFLLFIHCSSVVTRVCSCRIS